MVVIQDFASLCVMGVLEFTNLMESLHNYKPFLFIVLVSYKVSHLG